MSNKSGYDQFFKQKRQLKASSSPAKKAGKSTIEKNNLLIKKRQRKRKPMPIVPIFWCAIFLALSLVAVEKEEQILLLFNRLELKIFPTSFAQEENESKPKAEDKQESKEASSGDREKSSLDKFKEDQVKQANSKTWTEEEIAMFTSLENRKKELDRREEELKRLEAELENRRSEIDLKLTDLNKIRKGISEKLEETVQKDEDKVNKLVEVYSNMKPQQASNVIAKMDEDLAIRLLAKMKKQSAADILNLLEPDKAKRLSEKYVGYISMANK